MKALSSSFLPSTLPFSPSLTTRPSSPPPFLNISAIINIQDKRYSTLTATSHSPPSPLLQANISSNTSHLEIIFKAFDDFINNFLDPPLPPSFNPTYVLSGNFAPVGELPPTECQLIEGSLPPCLDGAYIRNGPNPQFYPQGPYHLFEGDGMLHCIRISDGRATFCSRYVKTYKYKIESRAGRPVLPNLFSGFHSLTAAAARAAVAIARVLTGQFNPENGLGLANTSLAFFGGQLFALAESDLPYAVRLTADGDIETLGRHDFDGSLSMSMTAHPKIDPNTGEAFAFRYSHVHPFLTYFWFDAEGRKQPDVPIFSLFNSSFFHDFAITNKYAIFPDIQMQMNLMKMIMGGGSPVRPDPTKVPRLGIIPRYAEDESEMRWFEVPGFNIMHSINAWDAEDGDDAIVMVAPNVLSIEHALERMDLTHGSLEKVRIDLKKETITRYSLSEMNLDFAVINPGYLGKKNRYVYAAVGGPFPKISGIVKLDISGEERRECTVAKRMFDEGCYGSEPFFVAREAENEEAEEDDGYVVSYVHDERSGESKFIVMEAKSADLAIVAAVKLPSRVPYGFHGLFVRECDLKNTCL